MSKFSASKFTSTPAQETTLTHEGGLGYIRPVRQELFIQAVSEMAEDSYYESQEDRQARLAANVAAVISEPKGWEWIARFVSWLRNDAGMRSVSIMIAAEAVAAGRPADATGPTARQLVASACARGDEPAEFLGYWLTFHGRKIPAAVKRGIADAAVRLYTQRNALRYDGGSKGVRMGDVIDLTHPSPASAEQSLLFKQLLDNRHNRGDVAVELESLSARARLVALSPDERHAFVRLVQSGDEEAARLFKLATAGQWEFVKSWLGEK